MTDALVAFLKARLDDDEQVARQAASREQGGASWRLEGATVLAGDGAPVARHTWADEGVHIARQDPARTLREAEAKRRILRAHAKWCEGRCEAKYPEGGFDAAHYWSIKALAAVYADHPDYLEEWRP
ncbi:DUF6221 family protein [Streptomyces sp. CFMR 7]|uniref:DUF6221 family protein n=1 Tax=Streptomyces sp. CFMR 7 TaxID=1649184 RepID=UPI0011A8F024|nr:DUF6221 family protein [Streptomyces sp. CFMR 7]